ncbi:MAG: DNA repair protein RecN [Eubacteriales bacterium]|nr:DNA repair protein RecN [Eubacteriales bacterium]MDD3199924.1 DNA repair protein RecN [Eubacteriales bacterium]MDD4630433.1 DNA repair protein RecN [Eubacteriales bacterium]
MISHIRIKDFAIIDTVELDFYEGLNIITGETGAGKSIIIEAVSLALGSRADTAFIRSGKDKAVIQMVADLNGEDYIITRDLSTNGKNVCRINDEIVSLAQLNKLCRRLADVHGQYDHQSLLNPDNHMTLIDSYNSSAVSPVKDNVSYLYRKYSNIKQELSLLLANEADSERKRDFMSFELTEINQAKLYLDEDEELSQRMNILQNSEKIYQNLSNVYAIICEASPSVSDGIGKSLHALQEISTFSNDISRFSEIMSDVFYKIDDLTSEIRKYTETVSFSPELLDETIQRINTLDTLKRKYGGSIKSILEYKDKITIELEKIENIDSIRDKLTQELKLAETELAEECKKLTSLRKSTSKEIEERVNEELKELNFKDTEFSVLFYEENYKSPCYSADGIDRIEFMITTNKGELPKPLVKIASGGEISRIMLAFKNIISDYDFIPTMIFDEIDVGISGITASIVGKKLLDISKNHQVICITHLPQIAAFGDCHYKIDKQSVNGATHTTVNPLKHEEKINEIARLIGGVNVTDITIKSAEELINLSKAQ